jgi:4-hydroxy-3-methylbut-2-enyl diphosphate reductase IspH
MIVVGGKTSANTRELVRLCAEIENRPTLFIGSAAEMGGSEWLFDGARTVGITGGTSTPIEDLAAVARRLIEIAGSDETRGRVEAIVAEALVSGSSRPHRTTSLAS